MRNLIGVGMLALLAGSGVGLKLGQRPVATEPNPEACAPVVLRDGQATEKMNRGQASLLKTALLEQLGSSVDVQASYCRYFNTAIMCHLFDGEETLQVDVPAEKHDKFYELSNGIFENKVNNLAILHCDFRRRQESCTGTGAKVVKANEIPTGAFVLHGNKVEDKDDS